MSTLPATRLPEGRVYLVVLPHAWAVGDDAREAFDHASSLAPWGLASHGLLPMDLFDAPKGTEVSQDGGSIEWPAGAAKPIKLIGDRLMERPKRRGAW